MLLLLLSSLGRAIAQEAKDALSPLSMQDESNNAKIKKALLDDIAKIKQLKTETANGFKKTDQDIGVRIAEFMRRRGREEPFLRDNRKDAGGRTISSQAVSIIKDIDETLEGLRKQRAEQQLVSQRAMKDFDNQILSKQKYISELDQLVMAKATHNLTHWGETNRIVSPGSSPAADSSLAASSSAAQANASESSSGNNFSAQNDAGTKTLSDNNPAPNPMLLAQATPMPTLAQPASVKLSGEDKLTLATLNDIIEDMNKPTDDATKRTKLLNEFLTQSEPFVASHPDYTNLWVARATAALELDNAEAGWKAGQELKRLNVLDGDDTKALKAMSGLKRKGWLVDSLKQVKSDTNTARTKELLDKLTPKQQKLIGKWKVSRVKWDSGEESSETEGNIVIVLGDDGSLSVRGKCRAVTADRVTSNIVEISSQPISDTAGISVDGAFRYSNGNYSTFSAASFSLHDEEIKLDASSTTYFFRKQ